MPNPCFQRTCNPKNTQPDLRFPQRFSKSGSGFLKCWVEEWGSVGTCFNRFAAACRYKSTCMVEACEHTARRNSPIHLSESNTLKNLLRQNSKHSQPSGPNTSDHTGAVCVSFKNKNITKRIRFENLRFEFSRRAQRQSQIKHETKSKELQMNEWTKLSLTATRGSAPPCRHTHSWSAAGTDWEPVGVPSVVPGESLKGEDKWSELKSSMVI